MQHIILLDDLESEPNKSSHFIRLSDVKRKRRAIFNKTESYIYLSRGYWDSRSRFITALQCIWHMICCRKTELFNSVFYDRYVLRKPMTLICKDRWIDKTNISQVRLELKEQIDLALDVCNVMNSFIIEFPWEYIKFHFPSCHQYRWQTRVTRSNVAWLQFITGSRHKHIQDRYADCNDDSIFFIF